MISDNLSNRGAPWPSVHTLFGAAPQLHSSHNHVSLSETQRKIKKRAFQVPEVLVDLRTVEEGTEILQTCMESEAEEGIQVSGTRKEKVNQEKE